MKIKINVTVEGSIPIPIFNQDGLMTGSKTFHYHFSSGSEQEVPDPLGRKLIRLGHANAVHQTSG